MFVSSCGGPSPKSDVDEDACEGDDPSCAVLSCPTHQLRNTVTGECESVCNLDFEVTTRAWGEKFVGCGNLGSTLSADQRQLAHQCVVDAVAARRPFNFIEWTTDAQHAHAYFSQGAGAPVTMLSEQAGGRLEEQTCTSLKLLETCMPGTTDVCLECVDASAPMLICDLKSF